MSETKRILIISDSLALPRSKPEEVLYEDTYPFMLRRDYEVFQISFGGGIIKEIVHQAHYYQPYKPDIIILHLGIVDCAYRAFPVFVDKGAVYSKFLDQYRRAIAKIISPCFLRRLFRFRYTKPSDFETSLYVLKKDFPNAKLLAIGIVPASNDYVKLIPGIDKSIVQYNAIIKRVVGPSFISLSELPTNAVMSDHHHINKIGHQFIYKNILGILRQDA
jgi:hypothetical protein